LAITKKAADGLAIKTDCVEIKFAIATARDAEAAGADAIEVGLFITRAAMTQILFTELGLDAITATV
jgi:hypothetical protein